MTSIQARPNPAFRGRLAHVGEVVGQPCCVRVVAQTQHEPSAQLGTGVEHGQRIVDRERGPKHDQLDVKYLSAGVGEASEGLPHHRCVAEHRIHLLISGREDTYPSASKPVSAAAAT
jgi:hypothetical protein